MIAYLEPHSLINTPRHPNLILHCGAHSVDLAEIGKVRTPRSTASWCPIPHHQLITTVQKTLAATNLHIGTQAHSLSHEGQRYFGLMEIQRREHDKDYCWVLGLRNSHDNTFPVGIVAGLSFFCCDNLAFYGEVKLARKHTRFILRDLPGLVQSAVGRLMERWHHRTAASPATSTLTSTTARPTISWYAPWMSVSVPTVTSRWCCMNGVNLLMKRLEPFQCV